MKSYFYPLINLKELRFGFILSKIGAEADEPPQQLEDNPKFNDINHNLLNFFSLKCAGNVHPLSEYRVLALLHTFVTAEQTIFELTEVQHPKRTHVITSTSHFGVQAFNLQVDKITRR